MLWSLLWLIVHIQVQGQGVCIYMYIYIRPKAISPYWFILLRSLGYTFNVIVVLPS